MTAIVKDNFSNTSNLMKINDNKSTTKKTLLTIFI